MAECGQCPESQISACTSPTPSCERLKILKSWNIAPNKDKRQKFKTREHYLMARLDANIVTNVWRPLLALECLQRWNRTWTPADKPKTNFHILRFLPKWWQCVKKQKSSAVSLSACYSIMAGLIPALRLPNTVVFFWARNCTLPTLLERWWSL